MRGKGLANETERRPFVALAPPAIKERPGTVPPPKRPLASVPPHARPAEGPPMIAMIARLTASPYNRMFWCSLPPQDFLVFIIGCKHRFTAHPMGGSRSGKPRPMRPAGRIRGPHWDGTQQALRSLK